MIPQSTLVYTVGLHRRQSRSRLVYLTALSGNKMILSRMKPASNPSSNISTSQIPKNRKNNIPSVDEFLEKRDYTGALTLLEYGIAGTNQVEEKDRWIGYCAFHLGDYKRAMSVYEALSHNKKPPEDVAVNLACCYFFLGMYPESLKTVEKAPESPLKFRLLFHLAHKLGDEKKLMRHHQELQDIVEDQLSLASIHYLRSHYQEAIDIYKKILLDNRLFLALNVYVALCYYKLDYYDVSQEVLNIYLQQYPDSAIALNLKACNHFRLYNGKAAENEMKTLLEHGSTSYNFGLDLIKHNLVVFRGGEGALQVLPSLIDVIPEARLNLVIYYLKQDELSEAYHLIKDLEPSVPQEYILKAVVNAAIGQETNNKECVKVAEHYFQMVGSSTSECDTIPGRQCMASCYFLNGQFEDVLLYLSSIKTYFHNDDNFNMNYAQAQAAQGNFKEAEDLFLLVQNEKYKNEYSYLSNLARCYIMNKKGQAAWELYLKMDQSNDSFNLLVLIANDCYKMGLFWYSARAFDMLDRLDSNPEYWEGKRGACCGVFQQIVAGKKAKELLVEVIQLLRNTANSQVETIIRIMKKWAKENRINI